MTRTAKTPADPPLCVFLGGVAVLRFQVPPRQGDG